MGTHLTAAAMCWILAAGPAHCCEIGGAAPVRVSERVDGPNARDTGEGIEFTWLRNGQPKNTDLMVYDLGFADAEAQDGDDARIPSTTLVYRREGVTSPHLVERDVLALIPSHRYRWHVVVFYPGGIRIGDPETFIAGDKYALPEIEGQTWQRVKLLSNSMGIPGTAMGSAVALDDGVAVIAGKLGSVRVHRELGSRWANEADLFPYNYNSQPGSGFGSNVAIDGDLIAVGAPLSHASGPYESGTVYLYRYYRAPAMGEGGGQWTHEYTLRPDKARKDARFGAAVSISGDTVVVGAPGERGKGHSTGAVYVFTYMDTHWAQTQRLASEDADDRGFGSSVSIDAQSLVVGAPDGAGSASVYRVINGQWTLQARLTSPSSDHAQRFGACVAVSGDYLLIGAPGTGQDQAGCAYAFSLNAGSWNQSSVLRPYGSRAGDAFGTSVAMTGATIVIGAGDGAYVFTHHDSQWSQRTRLVSGVGRPGDKLGSDVAIWQDDDGTCLVLSGAPGVDEQGEDQGAAYLHRAVGE